MADAARSSTVVSAGIVDPSGPNPVVSVVMGNYNYGRFIGQAMESVLDQSFEDFELIVVDDGSTDESRAVISSYHDPRPRVILQQNAGQAVVLNTGIAAARGEIVSFLDSDDWWAPEKLAAVVRWDRFVGGQYGVLQHALTVWHDGATNPYKRVLAVGDCFGEMQATGAIDFFVPTVGLSMRRNILKQVGPIPPEFRICADAYLMRTAIVHGPLYSIPESLGFYRKHRNAVFGNPDFRPHDFITKTLLPALNRYYQEHDHECTLGTSLRSRLAAKVRRLLGSISGAFS